VELSEGVIAILQDGEAAWRSPAEWTVVDLALGDPNHDGRYEILAAFWRDDAQGIPRSQPFIVGYRQGQVRTLWGGSPIAEPIVELELGDVTGDGVQDLIVLEAPPSDSSPHQGEAVFGDIRALLSVGSSPHRGEAGRGEPGAAATTIAVWQWHGWGFSRLWRSEEGLYQKLVLLPGVDGAPATFQVRADAPD
jgi:hypothetical protein